ncbi:glycoside hydrolase family 28 protein [Xylariomycetidae sp. FL0641]|nr:glycoside hydrolase family 28 protein [Xylariomycetidae sp. FL0641]
MLSQTSPSTAIALFATTVAALSHVVSPNTGKAVLPRPELRPAPFNSGRPLPDSPARNKTCFVTPKGDGGDDAPGIVEACQKCNGGGAVVLDANYTIGTPLDLTFLKSVDLVLTGTLGFTADLDYWSNNSFKFAYQNSSSYTRIGGEDVNIYGGGEGLIDGNGQIWWDAFAEDDSLLRPISLLIDGLHGGSVSGLHMINSPQWFNLIANSSDILITDMVLTAKTSNENPVKNSDGWDFYRTEYLVLQDSHIDNSDDCVSFKPNATNIVVQGLSCNGSHGISVGSLGQYVGEYDIVENVYIYNNTMANASDAARIKVWPGIQSLFEPTLNGGGGSGYVRNVTYEKYHSLNNDWAIEVNQCYGQDNATLCELHPSNMTISDIWFIDIWGTTSSKNDPNVGTLVCSSPEQCYDIHARNVSIKSPSGTSQWICANFDTGDLEGFDCVEPDDDED